MNKLSALACCTLAIGTVNAQDLIIRMKGEADPVVIPVSEIEYMEVKASGQEEEMQELVEMEVINMGRFSFDIKVKKSPRCEKYIIGAIASHVYNENNFVEMALQTLDETAFYRPYINSIGTESQTFAERSLGINVIMNYDTDTHSEVHTTIAICAIDKEGGHKVYTTEFMVPDPVTADSPTVSIEAGDVSSENFTVHIAASEDCKKLIYGITTPEALSGRKMSSQLMLNVAQSLPIAYSGAVSFGADSQLTVSPDATYYAYAMPIAEDGTIGTIAYTTVKTPAIVANGAGKIMSASGKLQTTGLYKCIIFPQMTFNDETRKVRVMWTSETDFEGYKNRLTEVFVKDKYSNIAWNEYSIDALPRTLNIYHYGQKYYMYAATVDKDGNVSEAQDVLALMGMESPYTTNAKSDQVPDINFDGTATASVVNDYTEIIYSPYVEGLIQESNPYFTITPGENLERVLVIRADADEAKANLEKAVESVLAGYPYYPVGLDGVECELIYNGGTWRLDPPDALYDCTIDGQSVRFKEKWLKYDHLIFVAIDTNGRPRILCTYDPEKGKLS